VKHPVKGSETRDPIVIQTKPPAEIIEARFRTITNPALGLVASVGQNTTIANVRWSILEEGDGGVLQVTYVGDEKVEFVLSGWVEGQRHIALAERTEGRPSTISSLSSVLAFSYAVSVTLTFLLLVIVRMLSRHRPKPGSPIAARELFVPAVLVVVLSVLLGIVVFRTLAPPGPPFSF
jgi:hypothetical protein